MKSTVRATQVPRRRIASGSPFDPDRAVVWENTTTPGVEILLVQYDEFLLKGKEAAVEGAAKFASKQVKWALTSRLAYLRSKAPEHDLNRDPMKVHLAQCLCGFPLYHAGGPDPLATLEVHRIDVARSLEAGVW